MQCSPSALASLWDSAPHREVTIPDFPIGVWPDAWSPWTSNRGSSSTSSSPRAINTPPEKPHLRTPNCCDSDLNTIQNSFKQMGLRDTVLPKPRAPVPPPTMSSIKTDVLIRPMKITGNRWTSLENELETWEKRLTRGQSTSSSTRIQLEEFSEFLRRLRALVRRKSEEGLELCAFCRNNGEPFQVYITHKVRDASGRVTCPVLRLLSCPVCKSTGDAAHTIKYCPYRGTER
ncbi:unnamed protein product [Echinostoma caproni]|uniref:Nanos-type domain-containing protein n=1 Tax=Echinostoma caproni TaxID=27848 RepID=A0A183A9W1_9TREM|nr:unnamed protein product [Echinostoma caproni]